MTVQKNGSRLLSRTFFNCWMMHLLMRTWSYPSKKDVITKNVCGKYLRETCSFEVENLDKLGYKLPSVLYLELNVAPGISGLCRPAEWKEKHTGIPERCVNMHSPDKDYDYSLKFLLVGDPDVGKEEILAALEDASPQSPYATRGMEQKTTMLMVDRKRVKLQLWSTSGQGRFCTVIRSGSRGAQGILLVYDIANKWSFDGIPRWLDEVNKYAPGIPKVLIGNRLHMAFNRQVSELAAEQYSAKHDMAFFEVSPLCDFNVVESFAELCRLVFKRCGMNRCWPVTDEVLSLKELCVRQLITRVPIYGIDRLPVPQSIKSSLKAYSMTHKTQVRMRNYLDGRLRTLDKYRKHSILNPYESPQSVKSCIIL